MTTHYVAAPGTVVVQPQGQQIHSNVVQPTLVTAPPYSPIDADYKATSSRNLGITQLLSACFAVLLNIVGISIGCAASDNGYGIWNGIMIGACGILGIFARNKNKSTITAYQITSIFGMIAACIMGLIGIIAVTIDRIHEAVDDWNDWNWWDPQSVETTDNDDDHDARVAIDTMMILLSLFINGSFIWTFCITCSCCRSTPTHAAVVTTTYIQPAAQQVVQQPPAYSTTPAQVAQPGSGAPPMAMPPPAAYGVQQPAYQ